MTFDWKALLQAARRGRADYRYTVAAVLGAVVVGAVVWSVSEPEYASTYYVVKWKATGLCTVVEDRPEDGRKFKTLWFTTLRRVAARKAEELHENGRCARVEERRRVEPFG